MLRNPSFKICIIMILTLYAVHRTIAYADTTQAAKVTNAVRVSEKATYETAMTFTDAGWARDISRARQREAIKLVPICDASMTLHHAVRSQTYLIDSFGYLIDQDARIRLSLPESRRIELIGLVRQLQERLHPGSDGQTDGRGGCISGRQRARQTDLPFLSHQVVLHFAMIIDHESLVS